MSKYLITVKSNMDHSPTLAINLYYVLEGHAQIWHSQTPQSSALESEDLCL